MATNRSSTRGACLLLLATVTINSTNAFAPSATFHAPLQTTSTRRPQSQQPLLLHALPDHHLLTTMPDLQSIQSASQHVLQSTSHHLAKVTAINPAVTQLENACSQNSLLHSLLHSPTTWSVLAMSSIVALLVAWEEAIENIRESTPKPIMPVIDSMLAEVGGLGFIGLFLSTIVTGGPLGTVVGSLSEEFLGEEELLLETFEFLHTFFFQVGILFFVIAGVVVGAVLRRVQSLSEISALALDVDGDGEVTLEELAESLEVESMIVDLDGDGTITEEEKMEALRRNSGDEKTIRGGLLEEYFMEDKERAGECLVIRERMMEELKLPQSFAIEYYFAEIFGENLEEIVELSPLTWIPLIPLIALDNSVDLTHDVVSASSANAFESCGYFFGTPWVLYSTLFLQALSFTWAIFNFWKMASIKKMLLPSLVRDTIGGEASLLPPRYMDDTLRNQFTSSRNIFESAEQLFFAGGGKNVGTVRNPHEELFGATGSKFPHVYRDSIQFHTWLCVAQIVYSTTQIIIRDGTALYLGEKVGNPEGIMPELILWSVFVGLELLQLSLAPTTFLNYCFVTSVEEFVRKDMVQGAIMEDPEDCLVL